MKGSAVLKFVFTAAAALGLATGLATAPALAIGTFGPVTISSCTLGNNGGSVAANSLEIKYFNNTANRHLNSVTFAIRYNGVWQHVTDSGNFNPGALIDHKFSNFVGVPWQGPNPGICRVSMATYDNGQVYRF